MLTSPVSPARLKSAVRASDAGAVRDMLAKRSGSRRPMEVDPGLLMNAIERGDLPMVRALLEGGVSPDAIVYGFRPPLVAAVYGAHFEMARALLEHGADADIRSDVPSAYSTAIRCLVGCFEPDEGLLGELLRREARADAGDIWLALHHGNGAMVRALLSNGVNPNGVVNGLWTPLMQAAWEWPCDMVEALAAHGALLNTRGRNGNTALHYASVTGAESGRKLEVLLQRGADYLLTNNSGQTPAEMARLLGGEPAAQFIEEFGPGCGPAWMRDARSRRIARVWFASHDGDRIGFNPNNIDHPVVFASAGEEEQAWTPMQGMESLQGIVSAMPGLKAATAFLPWLKKLAQGAESELAELEAAAGVEIEYRR